MKTIVNKCLWVVATIGFFALIPAQGPGPTPVCDTPKECINGNNSENGQQCGDGRAIETDTSVSYPTTKKYCTLYRANFVCQEDCNEKEWWHGYRYAVYCVLSDPYERTLLYYCWGVITSKAPTGQECDHCSE